MKYSTILSAYNVNYTCYTFFMEFLPFFLILIVGVLFSGLFRKFNLPWVLALIISGIIMGPQGIGLLEHNETIEFIGQIGLIFLMFMAGLETKISSFRNFGKSVIKISFLNATIPFVVGYIIGFYFEFGTFASLLLGIIFMSSSIAVIVPTLESLNIINTKLGRSIVSTTIIEDVASLVLLSILLQSVDPVTSLPLPSFYILLVIILIALRYGLPRLRNLIPRHRDEKDLFESEVRIVFALLLGTVVIFELLGLHSIIAGFFAGLVLSDSIKSEMLLDKLRTMSYGIFVPVFFVIIGMGTDIDVFKNGSGAIGLVALIVAGSILSKLFSGWVGSRIAGFNNTDSLVFGFATIPQLSTTLAVAFTAVELGVLDNQLATAMIILSIITTFIAPLVLRYIYKHKSSA